jgi:2-isopropylmalate synthase
MGSRSSEANIDESLSIGQGKAQSYNQIPSEIQKISILDSTLREGEQGAGISFTTRQRLQIAWMLDNFGVDFLEISPIVSKDHEECCKKMLRTGFNSKTVAHLRALPSDIDVALRCGAEWIAMYHSVSDIHLEHKLRVSRETALERSIKAVEYAKAHGLKLRFTLEDSSRSDPEFLKLFATEICKAGADRISLPDTLGALSPEGMYQLVTLIRQVTKTPIDLHCHNDLGLSLANALAGIRAGATQIHTTIDGVGERVGITSLAEIVMTLSTIFGNKLNVKLEMLSELSALLNRYTGINSGASKPIVGENAYRHKAGTHVAAVIRNPIAYELVPPKLVGNHRRVVFGELSGKNGAAFFLKVLGLSPNADEAIKFSQGLKNMRVGDLFELNLTDDLEAQAVEADELVKEVKR